MLVLGLFLGACKPEIAIEVTSSTLPTPTFRLRMDGEPFARFTEGEVRDPGGAPVWSFEAEVPGVNSGAETLVYGEPPEGFRTVVGPEPLEAGTRYTLFVVGKGLGRAELVPVASP